MLYAILRPITRMVLQGYYQKIFVNGQENIPKNQPVLLAVNHPSAFTEPCVLATHLDRELHFLIRGDVVNPKVKWFFDQTNQLPIYRFRDGFSSMRQNEKQFSYCFDLLENNGCIAIFAEGSTKHIKQTRPIQKGAARIAFGAMQNRNIEEVWIVPVGVNFEHSPRPRSRVAVQIGEPISTRALFPIYEADERQGLNELTDLIFHGLNAQMIHIAHNDRMEEANDLLLMASNEMDFRKYPVAEYGSTQFFDSLDRVAKNINQIGEQDWTLLRKLNQQYQGKLQETGLVDVGPGITSRFPLVWLFLTPLALLGWLFLGPIYWISFAIQKRLNEKDEYTSGFRMAGFLVFIPVFIILWMIALAPLLGWWVWTFWVIMPILSMIAVLWRDQLVTWIQKSRWRNKPPSVAGELLDLREQLIGRVRPSPGR